MQDWLNGVSSGKENEKKPQEKPQSSKPLTKPVPPKKGNLDSPSSVEAPKQGKKNGKKPQRTTQLGKSLTGPILPKKADVDSPSSAEAPGQSSTSTKDVLAAEIDTTTSNRDNQEIQPGAQPTTVAVDGADEFSGLAIVAQWHLRRQARRKEGGETKSPDLMDVNSPPLTRPRKFFDEEDMPISLPAPLLPAHSSCEGSRTPAEEDLMQFTDTRPGKGLGVLIPSPVESPADRKTNLTPTAQSISAPAAEYGVKTTTTVSGR